MADVLTVEQRHRNMSNIKGKDTSIELKVRKALFAQGFRYRKNVASLPGKPDIVLPKYHTVIFVHGCYWHRHSGCKYATILSLPTQLEIPLKEMKSTESSIGSSRKTDYLMSCFTACVIPVSPIS